MNHAESQLQRGCVAWFRAQYFELALNLIAIPNGGRRNKITAAIMKGEGVVPGAADLVLFYPSKEYHGLCIEMKTPVGRQSDTQKDWMRAVEMAGYKYVICRSLEDFMWQVNTYING